MKMKTLIAAFFLSAAAFVFTASADGGGGVAGPCGDVNCCFPNGSTCFMSDCTWYFGYDPCL